MTVAKNTPLLLGGEDSEFLNNVAQATGSPKPPKEKKDERKWALIVELSACRMLGNQRLFNALTATAAAQAANFPFCTIEPNIGRVAVPDDRLSSHFPDRKIGHDCAHAT
jgi:hypothetical protein